MPMDIPYETLVTPLLCRRYRRLAGPFAGLEEKPLLDGVLRYLTRTGARITTVGEADGVYVWRLGSECETRVETEQRLAKLKCKIKKMKPL
jgi:hypothetical protein